MAKTRQTPVEEPPARRGRLFWICILVLLEAVVWTILSVIGVSETIATVVALVVGVAFVIALRERIWGEDWRERIAAERAKRPR
jgi:uncharacterized membrane protein